MTSPCVLYRSGFLLDEEERAGCSTIIVFLVSWNCDCCVTLSHGAVDRSAVCDCGICISYSTHAHLHVLFRMKGITEDFYEQFAYVVNA